MITSLIAVPLSGDDVDGPGCIDVKHSPLPRTSVFALDQRSLFGTCERACCIARELPLEGYVRDKSLEMWDRRAPGV